MGEWFDGGYAYEGAKRGPELILGGKSLASGDEWAEEVSVSDETEVIS